MYRVLASLLFVLLLPAKELAAQRCGFTNGAVVSKRIALGIETMDVEREWRGMVELGDDYWVDFSVSASYPRFSRETFPAARAINAELEKHIEADLAFVGECPEEAQLPSRRKKLVDGHSDVEIHCELSHASRTLVSIFCTTSLMTMLNARPEVKFEQLNFALDGAAVKRLRTDDVFRTGAARERLLSFVRAAMAKEDASREEEIFVEEEELASGVNWAFENPKLAADRLVITFMPTRWVFYCVELPRSEWEWALTPDFFARLTQHPSSVSGKAAFCGESP